MKKSWRLTIKLVDPTYHFNTKSSTDDTIATSVVQETRRINLRFRALSLQSWYIFSEFIILNIGSDLLMIVHMKSSLQLISSVSVMKLTQVTSNLSVEKWQPTTMSLKIFKNNQLPVFAHGCINFNHDYYIFLQTFVRIYSLSIVRKKYVHRNARKISSH